MDFPPPPPTSSEIPGGGFSSSDSSDYQNSGVWERVKHQGTPPCQRSLHAAAVWNNHLLLFGGYDGIHRINDLHAFNFDTGRWEMLAVGENCPSPRDRHIAVVWGDGFYIFGGFDGLTRVNDMHRYDMVKRKWEIVECHGSIPTPRHSHAAVVFEDSLYLFGGYDGSYRCDFHRFDFETHTWRVVETSGKVPRSRYRGTCVVHDDRMILHGGHDGNKHLQDTHIYNFTTCIWSEVPCTDAPSPRDSHIGVVYGSSMYILGGSTGVAMGDFHELNLEKNVWRTVRYQTVADMGGNSSSSSTSTSSGGGGGGLNPSSRRASTGGLQITNTNGSGAEATTRDHHLSDGTTRNPAEGVGKRFCHIGVVYDNALFIFGGYDGANRLNDFQRFHFHPKPSMKSTLVGDMKKLVNSELLSDITFLVEDEKVYGHKLLCLRCPYFNHMFTGEYMESKAAELSIDGIRLEIFILFLEYLYSDSVDIQLNSAMELFEAADRFGMERLKKQCEYVMYGAINVDTASEILLAADLHSAETLRERCIRFVVMNFDAVSLTKGFHDMSRANLELNIEILKKRMDMKGG